MKISGAISDSIKRFSRFEAASSSVHFQVFSGFILMYFAFYLGFGVLELTFTFTAVSLSRIASFFGAWLAHRTSNKKNMAFLFKGIAVILTGLLPFLADIQQVNTRFLLFLAIMTSQAMLYSIGGSIWCNWVRSGVSERQINGFLKDRFRVSTITSIVTLFVVSVFLEKLPEIAHEIPLIAPLIASDPLLFAFKVIFWSATIAVLLGFFLQAIITNQSSYQSGRAVSIKSMLATLFSNKYALILLFAVIFGCGFYMICDLFFIHSTLYLGISVSFSAVLLIILLITIFTFSNKWKTLANRFGAKNVMLLVILPAGFLVLVSTFLATKEVPWLIIATPFAIGLCVGAINSLIFHLFIKVAPPEERDIISAGFNCITGLSGAIGILFSGLTMHFLGKTQLPVLSGIKVLPFHSVAMVFFLVCCISFVVLRKIIEPPTGTFKQMLPHVIPVLLSFDKNDK